ncbi:TPA: hypothetical protein N3A33_001815 [Salmonella enterica subsp. salamae serovar 28:r:e,n,z15]|nr:hypothetical protein [Salmonella enterica subsp. salamae serovar 28:r:e,n,z15]
MPQEQNSTLASTTATTQSNKENVRTVVITRTKPLCVILTYVGTGASSMMKAALFKKKRLLEKFPTAQVDIEKIKYLTDFNSAWESIYKKTTEKTKGGILRYDLYEVHFMGHGAPDRLYFLGFDYTVDMVERLKVLPWDKEYGILVLHACRTGRLKENEKGEVDESATCIASEFSRLQNTKVIGQMVHATFCINHSNTIETDIKFVRTPEGQTIPKPIYRIFDYEVGFKYRDYSISNIMAISLLREDDLVLWAYKAGSNVKNLYSEDKEYKRLADMQIWPCRLFINGEAQEEQRVVEVDKFNSNDLEYM